MLLGHYLRSLPETNRMLFAKKCQRDNGQTIPKQFDPVLGEKDSNYWNELRPDRIIALVSGLARDAHTSSRRCSATDTERTQGKPRQVAIRRSPLVSHLVYIV